MRSRVTGIVPSRPLSWVLRYPLGGMTKFPHDQGLRNPRDSSEHWPREIRNAVALAGGFDSFIRSIRSLHEWSVPTVVSTFGSERSRQSTALRVEGFDRVLAAAKSGTPPILVVPHLGPWLSVAAHLLSHDIPVTEISLFDSTEAEVLRGRFGQWLPKFRNPELYRPVYARDASATVKLIAALRQGSVVIWQPDVFSTVAPTASRTLRFLGHDRAPSRLPFVLSERSGAQLFLAIALADNPLRPRTVSLSYRPILPVGSRSVHPDDLYRTVEAAILANLGQWSRWPTYPDF